MKRFTFLLLFLSVYSAFAQQNDYPIVPVGFQQVSLQNGFWKSRVETATKVTIPYAFQKCEETGRVDNFKKAGGLMSGQYIGGFGFDDTDVYKIIEGASYSLMTSPDPEMDAYLDTLISYIAAAQEADGYLYTAWSLKANENKENKMFCCTYSDKGRFYNLNQSHELYNPGHMYEAAVAHFYATGKDSFLKIATKNADLIYDLAITHQMPFYSGHQEIELGLVKLYRATSDHRYLDLAKEFLDRRGKNMAMDPDRDHYGEYSQDHIPVIDQKEAVGHSVRAGYMYASMADIAAIKNDKDYLKAADAIWENIVTKKMYVTGGLGAVRGHEGFDKNYELPNDCYAETCAAISNVYFNHRMFLLHGSSKYIDVLERSLYNGVLPGLSLEGDKFFYPNPLEFDGKSDFNQGANCRKGWFDCSCCPSNLSRFIPSVAGYIYAVKGSELYVNLFMNNETSLELEDGQLDIIQNTNYPWDGRVQLTFKNQVPVKSILKIRIPGWAMNEAVPGDLYAFTDQKAQKITLRVNGDERIANIENGYALISGEWYKEDVIELILPMETQQILAHPMVEADQGKIAVQRGPLVYCAEGIDNNGKALSLEIAENEKFEAIFDPTLLDGITILKGKGKTKPTLVPYYAWAHRDLGEMAVWLPQKKK
ncbi:glycoside hydrolase family 127 protein [Jiulongibacter sp. NS-SX5]|uniref:glycoside hydrolase family 127 protein n=1 Tax=Jiulongibacter sp. NS-SX5 TaxID=3463854 RepID=UPI00405A2D68